jgi:hypothetical protein
MEGTMRFLNCLITSIILLLLPHSPQAQSAAKEAKAKTKDHSGEALHPKLWEAATRKLLQREAASAHRAIELQTCQQISEYSVLYPLPAAAAGLLEGKAQTSEVLRPKPLAVGPLPASGKVRGIQKRPKNQ